MNGTDTKVLPETDVLIVGMGWTGSILAKTLTDAGLRVVGLERGKNDPPGANSTGMHDELKYQIRKELTQDVSKETYTFRNNSGQLALPIRRWGSFLPGNGVGGAGRHWNGQLYRFPDSDLNIKSHYIERYGKNFIPDEIQPQDSGVSYNELEPYYDLFERVCGASGKAGNINGKLQSGGNPFAEPRSKEFPNPPLAQNGAGKLFADATQKLGYHPFVLGSANITRAYKTLTVHSYTPVPTADFALALIALITPKPPAALHIKYDARTKSV